MDVYFEYPFPGLRIVYCSSTIGSAIIFLWFAYLRLVIWLILEWRRLLSLLTFSVESQHAIEQCNKLSLEQRTPKSVWDDESDNEQSGSQSPGLLQEAPSRQVQPGSNASSPSKDYELEQLRNQLKILSLAMEGVQKRKRRLNFATRLSGVSPIQRQTTGEREPRVLLPLHPDRFPSKEHPSW